MSINSYVHVDSASAGGGDGSSWALSGASAAFTEAEFETWLEGTFVAGDVAFVKDGTYTLDSDIDWSARAGTKTSPGAIIGVKASTTNTGANVAFSDWAIDAADKPLFDGGAYRITTPTYMVIRNIEFTSTNAQTLNIGSYVILENCKCENTSTGVALFPNTSAKVINNEITSTAGIGVFAAINFIFLFNYLHDITASGKYALGMANGNRIAFNVFDTCIMAIDGTSDEQELLLNNTFYECDIAVDETDGADWICINNIIEGSDTYGFRWTTQTDINYFCGNHGDDTRNTDMWSNVDTTTIFQDYEVTTGDPLFEAAASGDFRLATSSPCLDTGCATTLGMGGNASTINKGAYQNPVGGGGGLMTAIGMNGGIDG